MPKLVSKAVNKLANRQAETWQICKHCNAAFYRLRNGKNPPKVCPSCNSGAARVARWRASQKEKCNRAKSAPSLSFRCCICSKRAFRTTEADSLYPFCSDECQATVAPFLADKLKSQIDSQICEPASQATRKQPLMSKKNR